MKRIKWELPFKSIDYLESMTEDLVNNPYIILITATEDHKGIVESCTIGIKENDNMDEVILLIGATIGAHSVAYAAQTIASEDEFIGFCLGMPVFKEAEAQEENEVILLPEVAGGTEEQKAEFFEENEDLFEKSETQEVEEEIEEKIEEQEEVETEEETVEEEVIEEEVEESPVTEEEIEEVIEKTPDSPAKALLRKILENFKKTTLGVLLMALIS